MVAIGSCALGWRGPGSTANAVLRESATRPVMFWLFFATALIYLFTAGSNFSSGDSFAELHVTSSLVGHGWFDVPVQAPGTRCAGWGCQGTDGKFYATHAIGYSVFMIPFYGLAQAALHGTGASHCSDPLWTRCVPIHLVSWNTCLVTAATVTLLALFALDLGYSLAAALAAALLYGFATMAWPYARYGFDVTLTGFFVLASAREASLAMDQKCDETARWFRCGAWTALAILVRLPTAPIVLPLAAACWLVGSPGHAARYKRVAAYVVPLLVAGAFSAWYNVVRFGSVFDDGHTANTADKLSSAPWSGLFGILISPGKGLLWYCPVVVLVVLSIPPFFRARRSTCVLALSVAAVSVIPYVFVNDWYGGNAWGPRFVMPVLPVLVLPILELGGRWSTALRTRAASVAIIAISCFAQVSGLLVSYPERLALAERSGYGGDIFWNPAHSPIVDHVGTLLTYVLNPTAATHPVPVSHTFDVWWLNLWRIDGMPPVKVVFAGILVGLLAAGATLVLRAQMKRLGSVPPVGGQSAGVHR